MWRLMKRKTSGGAGTEYATGSSAIDFVIILVIGLLLSAAILIEQKVDPLRSYFDRCIDQEIARCEPAAWIYSVEDPAAMNSTAVEKARFFAENREMLITLMEAHGFGRDQREIHYFLNRAAQKVTHFNVVKGSGVAGAEAKSPTDRR